MLFFFFSDMPIILLLYKNTYFNTNELDSYVLGIYITLLQKFKVVFLDEYSKWIATYKRSNIKLI